MSTMAGFVTPDFSAPLDPAAYLALCTDAHQLKGLFMQGPLDVVQRAGMRPPKSKRYFPFKDYPCAEYVELVVECARIAFPRSPLREAIRRVGWDAYTRFSSSMVGKVILAATGSDVVTTFKAADKAYSVLLTRGSANVEGEEGRVLVELRDIVTLADTFHVGAMESILEAFGKKGTVRLRSHSLVDVDLLVQW